MTRAGVLSLGLVAAGLAGCFDPPWRGDGSLQCAATAPACPPGLICIAGGCYYPAHVGDGGLDLTAVSDGAVSDGAISDGAPSDTAPADLIRPTLAIGWDAPQGAFGLVKLATTATRNFRVFNPGQTALSSIAITTTGDAEFAVTTNGCASVTLQPDEHCDVSVSFSPTVKKAYNATLRAESMGSFATVDLSGSGGDPVNLTIQILGDGTGTVSAGGGIICSTGTCMFTVEKGTMLSFAATNPFTSAFTGWSDGAATCGLTTPCALAMNADTTVTATFELITFEVTIRKLELSGATGTIQLGATTCGAGCTSKKVTLPPGAQMLSASADGANVLLGWPSGCTGRAPSCNVSVQANTTYTVVIGPSANYAFVTPLNVAPGSLGGVGGADTICQNAATAGGLPDPSSYVAWLSTSTQAAPSRLAGSRGWVRPDGLPFGDTPASFTTGKTVWYPLLLSAGGSKGNGSELALTGTDADGHYNAGGSCGEYANSAGNATLAGDPWRGYPGWTEGAWTVSCNQTNLWYVYCFGKGKDVALTLPPATGRRLFLSSTIQAVEADFVNKMDALCQTQGGSAAFRALLTPAGASAASRFDLTKGIWTRPDGAPVAFDNLELFQNGALLPIDFDASGASIFASTYWLGSSSATSSTTTENCSDWTSTSGSTNVRSPSATGITYFSGTCGNSYNVLCLEN